MAAFERRMAFRFNTPSSMMVVGPSGCGKTVFTTKLLVDHPDLFETPPKKFTTVTDPGKTATNAWNNTASSFTRAFPIRNSYPSGFPNGGLLVLDDLMEEGGNDKRVLDLFTKHSHHQDVTVIYLCRDMFPPGKFAKSISRNAHYIVGFKNPCDQ